MVCPKLISEQSFLYIKGSRELLSGFKKKKGALNLKNDALSLIMCYELFCDMDGEWTKRYPLSWGSSKSSTHRVYSVHSVLYTQYTYHDFHIVLDLGIEKSTNGRDEMPLTSLVQPTQYTSRRHLSNLPETPFFILMKFTLFPPVIINKVHLIDLHLKIDFK